MIRHDEYRDAALGVDSVPSTSPLTTKIHWAELPVVYCAYGKVICANAVDGDLFERLCKALREWRETGSCLDFYPGVSPRQFEACEDADDLTSEYEPSAVDWSGLDHHKRGLK